MSHLGAPILAGPHAVDPRDVAVETATFTLGHLEPPSPAQLFPAVYLDNGGPMPIAATSVFAIVDMLDPATTKPVKVIRTDVVETAKHEDKKNLIFFVLARFRDQAHEDDFMNRATLGAVQVAILNAVMAFIGGIEPIYTSQKAQWIFAHQDECILRICPVNHPTTHTATPAAAPPSTSDHLKLHQKPGL